MSYDTINRSLPDKEINKLVISIGIGSILGT